MAYRRSSDTEALSPRWRTAHAAELVRWLPERIVASDRSLAYVVLHGDDAPGTGWSVDWLSPEEAGEFLRFLARELPDSEGFELPGALRRRSGKGE